MPGNLPRRVTDPSAVPSGIAADPTLLTQALDPVAGLVRLVRMDAEAYREASFLDDRMFARQFETILCRWSELVAEIGPSTPTDARWIFHIGHVGSTLVARLLGELTLSIREPRILRDFSGAFSNLASINGAVVARLLSRRFAGDQPTLVKATSFVSEVASHLCPPGERALFLFASPRNYIRSILAGENSRKELALLAGPRAIRMAGRASLPDARASEAHLAAAAWACEMTSLEASAEAMLDRAIHWVDFDLMLRDMPTALKGLTGFFDYEADPAVIAAIASGPLMRRYSKALEFDYSPALRRELIAEAGYDHRSSIEAAMDMLHKAAGQAPLLARALSRASWATEC
jgi:hypothetical protein